MQAAWVPAHAPLHGSTTMCCSKACKPPSLPMLLQRNTEFGYSRKDVILIGAGMIGAGYALYYGLQVGRQRRSCATAAACAAVASCAAAQHAKQAQLLVQQAGACCSLQRCSHSSWCVTCLEPCLHCCLSPAHATAADLQATGMEPGIAGNWAQLIIFVGLCFGWVGSYLYRVATKVGRVELLCSCDRGCFAAVCSEALPGRAFETPAAAALQFMELAVPGLPKFPTAANDVREAAGGVRGGGDAQAAGGDARGR